MPKAKKQIEDDFLPQHGRKAHQQMKAYLVLDYLMKHTDEQHHTTPYEIAAYLSDYGIEAQYKSVKSDIDEINYVLYMMEQGCSIDVAIEDLNSGEYEEEKIIQCTENRREYFMNRRLHDITEDDARLLAETVYSAPFLDEKKAKRLVGIASTLVSNHAAERIKHDIPILDRPRTTNTRVYNNVSLINEAMHTGTKAAPHLPEKITFRYQKYCIDNVEKTVDRRGGSLYKVSPYKLLIDEGNYYLRAFDDRSQSMRTYRVDRMKNVSLTGEPRDGEEFYDEADMKTFPRRVFGMWVGERVKVTLLFDNCLLDAAIERLGRRGLEYEIYDEDHFTVSPEVELSDQFFAWLCRFRKLVKILAPEAVAEDFKQYLEDIRSLY